MSMKKFKRSLALWGYGLIGGMLGGGVGALAAWGGLAGASAAGANVPTLNVKGIGVVFITGIISHGVLYVMKSPLPPLEFDDSKSPFPNVEGAVTKPKDP